MDQLHVEPLDTESVLGREPIKAINNRFSIERLVSRRAFYEIYSGRDTETNSEVFIRVEEVTSKFKILPDEFAIFRNLQGIKGISTLHWTGTTDTHYVIISQRLSYDLESLFNLCGRKFGCKTVLMVADQMLHLIEAVHNKGYLLGNLSPDNIWFGGPKADSLHFMEFMDAQSYIDPNTGKHIPCTEDNAVKGAIRYCSINTHEGTQSSRRDDLESLGYVLIYLVKGYLPWQGVKAEDRVEKYMKILEKKVQRATQMLKGNTPNQYKFFLAETDEEDETFAEYLKYCLELKFDEKPDYAYLRKLFKDLLEKIGSKADGIYDWNTFKEGTFYTNEHIDINAKDLYKDPKSSLSVVQKTEPNIASKPPADTGAKPMAMESYDAPKESQCKGCSIF